jgi:hypothetical protein
MHAANQLNQVTVLLVALRTSSKNIETVICRNPEWQRLVLINGVYPGDELLITTTNGGTVTLSYNLLQDKSYDGAEFETGIKNVPLASSLRLKVTVDSSNALQSNISNPSKSKWAIMDKINTLASIIAINESITSESLLLSIMVVLVTLRLLFTHTPPETYRLWILLSLLLACHSFYLVRIYGPLFTVVIFVNYICIYTDYDSIERIRKVL